MFRAGLACALVLLSGCLASAPVAPVQEIPPAADDGMVVTATRVEPLVHPVDQHGVIQAHSCLVGADEGCDSVVGLTWDSPTFDFGDPMALFWRVAVLGHWSGDAGVTAMRLTVLATAPCGVQCLDEREVAHVEGSGDLPIDHLDVFLQPGETGVRLRLEASGTMETTMAKGVDYSLVGDVAGYRPAGDPIVL